MNDIEEKINHNKRRTYINNKVADMYIFKDLNFNNMVVDFSIITEEVANEIIRKVIEEKNKAMDEAIDEELSKLYSKSIHFISKDKYIEKHKQRILNIEKYIIEQLDLSWYDKEFFSDNARFRFNAKFWELKEEVEEDQKSNKKVERNWKKAWEIYHKILIFRHSKAWKARLIYDRLASQCKFLDYNEILISQNKHSEAVFEESGKQLAMMTSYHKQIKKQYKENRENYWF